MNLRLVTALCFLLALPHSGGFATENTADATPQAPLFRGDESRPADALVLFDGSDVSAWTTLDGKQPIPWKVENGYMEVRGGNIRTRAAFTDVQLHLEFWLPLMADAKGQARANSGVYLQGSYEVQILDSYGEPPRINEAGAIYGVAPPMVNASRPPETWQSYDILFRAPRYDADGKLVRNARMTVFHNGVCIHDNVEIPGPTAAAMERPLSVPGPIMIQDHGNPIRFRNIWVRPLR